MNAPKWSGAALGLAALALLAAGEVHGGGQTKLPPAKTPEEAVKNFLAACIAGDAALLLDQIGEPVRSQMQGMMARKQMHEDIIQAMNDQFGKDPKFQSRTLKESLQTIKSIVVLKKVVDQDRAAMTVWLTEQVGKDKTQILEQRWQAVQEGGSWKVLVNLYGGAVRLTTKKGPDGKDTVVSVIESPPPDPKGDALMLEYMKKVNPKMRVLADQFIAEIKAGAYKTRAEGEKAIQEASDRFEREHPLPGSEKKATKKDEKKQ